jgi:hypothetical protein
MENRKFKTYGYMIDITLQLASCIREPKRDKNWKGFGVWALGVNITPIKKKTCGVNIHKKMWS